MINKSYISAWRQFCPRFYVNLALVLCLICLTGFGLGAPAQASLNDDHYDGNIFALYGGNGSLVPARVTLDQSLNGLKRPALLTFYVDDSLDCKLYTPLLNQVQAFYGKEVSIIPVAVDSLDLDHPTSDPTQEAYYYRGFVPQTVLVDPNGKIRFDQEGKPSFESLELALRETLDLPFQSVNSGARDSTVRQINEVNP